ncbi:docking domain of Afi1 for Arf3 in vesicle trafficking-domain-containing protein [Aspergillus pseudonomiae]|uniref:Docking domain of Afi1 for Arf3 in vesicle trafficking-domain-containing protein n=1 Tax=Aspergillus pseudonomiae TaxID=1506151 RepID=A0A5N6IGI2_9EURO|nr:docking domain of Afi1 for Arf3 in vesicle trafficking-domain-containing protein [Aspergillus pseudonomiae]KAB8265568.1 docking domain of Afi1 for Arf3 in vesicle trafficking-domain-containing protein [Aspergillus pseudonomiae]KAE8397062.1 docking domain of Afi1 for Arf3 in vesicle trafficking-domain-containing protein [Aspergillus pseudonomiae]
MFLPPERKMSLTLPHRPSDDAARSLPTSSSSKSNGVPRLSPSPSFVHNRSVSNSATSVRGYEPNLAAPPAYRQRKCKSQYPRDSSERHVEYILVASFHIDRGPIMEHQYPAAISGDESMLAELMLPDQTHVRSQDWTIFFLHKDSSADQDDDDSLGAKKKKKKSRTSHGGDGAGGSEEDQDESGKEEESSDDEDEGGEGPPLMYVLNLVNTKQDHTVKRGAVVKAMAICTRHSFLHIYKPLLLLALEDYFKNPYLETLASLYNALNDMDLSLLPKLSLLERQILQASNCKDMFIEKFEQMIRQRIAEEGESSDPDSPTSPKKQASKYTLPRDTHEFESRIVYNDIPIPVKVPTVIWPEVVGDFSLIKLIQTFSGPHSASPQPFPIHPHLTTSGPYTHPIIILVNAMLTQKRVVFLGHNRPSGEVAEAVLAACALASGGILRGFTRHAFPYTDLTKIDDLLKVPGFIAGVTNPTFANHPEWWDVLCDLPTGRIKISSHVEPAPITEGLLYFQQQGLNHLHASNLNSDPTGDNLFMEDVQRSITNRYGENAIRAKWRAYILKFARVASAFEETVYGASNLYIIGPNEELSPESPSGVQADPLDPTTLRGHGHVWPDEISKQRELMASVSRIEGWRTTRSYYSFIQDIAAIYYPTRPIIKPDLHHHHERLRTLKLSSPEAGAIYIAFAYAVKDYAGICQLLTVTPENQAGLFYLSMGLFHPDQTVREATVDLLERISKHPAGQHFWNQLNRFAKLAFFRVKRERDAASQSPISGPEMGAPRSLVGVAMGDGLR